VAGAFRFVARMAEAGIDMAEFVKGLVRHFRDLFVLAAVGGDVAVDTTSEDLGRLQSQATRFGADRIGRVLEILERLTTELRFAADQRLAVEVAMTRMARPQGDLTLASLAERVDALEAGAPLTDIAAAPSPAMPEPRPVKVAAGAQAHRKESDPKPAPAPSTAETASEGARGLDVATVKRAWPAVLAEIKKIRAPRAHIFNGTEAEVVSGTLVVEFPADQRFAMDLARETGTLGVLRRAVRTVLGQEPPVEYRLGRSGASLAAGADTAQAPQPVVEAGAAGEADVDLEASVLAELGGELMEDVTDGQDDG